MKKLSFILCLVLPFFVNGQIITTIAGDGSSSFSGEGIPATAAHTPCPTGGEFDKFGNYYFAEYLNSHRIRRIDVAGIITTVAGNGSTGYSGDGVAATSTSLYGPQSVKFDTSGNMYINDRLNNRIRKVDKTTGIITTVAGTGTGGFSGDSGQATAAKINNVQDICFDIYNNLYLADASNYRIRKITPSGIISTFAGTGTGGPYIGEGTRADTTNLGFTQGLCSDATGNIYLANSSTGRVSKISTLGIMTTVAGNGTITYSSDGIPATSAALSSLCINIDTRNSLYITDRINERVYKVDGSTSILTTIAGNGTAGDNGDGGPATAAEIYTPAGVAIDPCGNVYIPTTGSAASTGKRIRMITYPSNPSISVGGVTNASIGSPVTINAILHNIGVSYSIKWYNKGVLLNITTTPYVTYTKTMYVDSIMAVVYGCGDSATSAIHVVGCNVGVGSLKSAVGRLLVYPNPMSRELTISAEGKRISDIIITNLLGVVVIKQSFNEVDQANVNVAHLASGMYIVKVNGIYVQKVIKE